LSCKDSTLLTVCFQHTDRTRTKPKSRRDGTFCVVPAGLGKLRIKNYEGDDEAS
jgi:hypothetical protein